MEPRLVDIRDGHVLYRGPRPTSREDFDSLRCRTVINLESGIFEFIHDKAYEEDSWGYDSAIIVRHLPLSDFIPPSESEIQSFLGMVRVGLQRGNVYVHCLHGVDRTGFMIACYRVRVQGWSPLSAIEEMMALGFHRWFYWFWVRKLLYS